MALCTVTYSILCAPTVLKPRDLSSKSHVALSTLFLLGQELLEVFRVQQQNCTDSVFSLPDLFYALS